LIIVSTDSKDLLILVSVPHEVEAAAIVAAMDQDGIQAVAAGGSTSGFKAEAPGEVQVLVKRSDAHRAQQTLQEIRSRECSIDWSEVDVGDPEE
jgi:predicted RNA binding protein YcfA (HicA-like mRNA interferase family)